MKEQLPDNKDKLFKDEEDLKTGAWLDNPTNKFFLYSEGYKEAGKRLYEYCIENPFYNNSLIYKLIFNYRQFIELRLKELIIMGYKYLDDDENDFPDEHSLLKLCNIYRNKILPNIDKTIEDEFLDNVERIITEFNKEDPKSMSFRYPVTRAPERKASLNRSTVDIKNFKDVVDKLIYFFNWQWDMISHYEDLKQEMIADIYREYWN
jgi:hypothetical protein